MWKQSLVEQIIPIWDATVVESNPTRSITIRHMPPTAAPINGAHGKISV